MSLAWSFPSTGVWPRSKPLDEGSNPMAGFDSYKDAFPHARLTRSPSGVLEVVLHTNGGTLIFNGHTHEEFVDLFHQSARTPRTGLSS